VIVVFTKYDQYKRDIKIILEDQGNDTDTVLLNAETERIFKEQFLAHLRGSPPFVRWRVRIFLVRWKMLQ
jgi:hypothetical protein